jgi:antitoxin VapB
MTTARLFAHGGSQALRLPREFRFEGTEVFIRRAGNDVVISAKPPPSVDGLIAALDEFEPGVRLVRERPEPDTRADIAPLR